MAVYRGFKFNLLPGPSKEEIIKEEQRDTNSIYIAFLPIVTIILWFLILLASGYIKNSYVDSWNNSLIAQKKEIASYTLHKSTNGELFQKTKSLKSLIGKHINPDEFFRLVEQRILDTSPSTFIKSYGREEGDKFSVTADATSYEEVAKIVYAFTSDPSFTDVKFKNVSLDQASGFVTFSLEFVFIGTTTTTEN